MATSQEVDQVPLSLLSAEHFSAVERAISNILASNLGLETYAQVVNGMPIPRSWDAAYRNDWWLDDNPNPEPGREARDIVEKFVDQFNIAAIYIDTKVAQRFQDEHPASKEFFLRLIEIVAIVCHDIAATLFDTFKGGLRKLVFSRLPNLIKVAGSKYPPYVTLLSHKSYFDHEYYPRGWTDTVGYWAEDQLFGGVVLFDRGKSGSQCNGIFLNPIAGLKIFQLTEAQIQQLIQFLTEGSSEKVRTCLPFRAEEQARLVHHKLSIVENVYRNQYDRRAYEYRPPHCCNAIPKEDHGWLDKEYEKLSKLRNRSNPG